MEISIKVESINHNDLVTLLSDAFYGSTIFHCYCPDEVDNKYTSFAHDCREDVWARTLLNGGYIEIVDYEDDWKSEESMKKYYNGKKLVTPISFYYDEEGDDHGFVSHRIYFNDIKRALESSEVRNDVLDFINGNNDAYTGYNIMQVAMFGEIVYD